MSENKVLATVGGRQITDADVNNLMKSLGQERAVQFDSEQGRKRLLEELINQELFYLDAVEKNLAEDAGFKTEFVRMSENLLKQYAINKTLSSVKIDNKELENFYNENKASFKEPESVRASHILVDSEQQASEILSEINQGLSFGEAARKYSECPSKAQGGDLGYFTEGQMVPEFEKAAFELNPGEMSHPVKTQFGYHIIKLEDKKASGIKSFEEVESQLHQQLIGQKQEQAYFNKVNELMGKYEIKKM